MLYDEATAEQKAEVGRPGVDRGTRAVGQTEEVRIRNGNIRPKTDATFGRQLGRGVMVRDGFSCAIKRTITCAGLSVGTSACEIRVPY